jgi:hypothetical protein
MTVFVWKKEENYEKPHALNPVSELRLEAGTSEIQNRSANHWTSTHTVHL